MSSANETVEAFMAMWARPGGFVEAIRRYFTPATRYQNIGMSDTTGIEQAVAFIEAFETACGCPVTIRVTTLASAANGGTVLNERIDEVIDDKGAVISTIRLMGIFEVEDGKITQWRDYFDTAGLAAARAK